MSVSCVFMKIYWDVWCSFVDSFMCIKLYQWSYRNLRRIRQVFRNIVFCRMDFYIYMQILFRDRFENVLFFFYIMNVSEFSIVLSFLFWVDIFKWDGFNEIFFMKLNHFSVDFCYLKNCTSVFGKSNNCRLCPCCRITRALVIFAR